MVFGKDGEKKSPYHKQRDFTSNSEKHYPESTKNKALSYSAVMSTLIAHAVRATEHGRVHTSPTSTSVPHMPVPELGVGEHSRHGGTGCASSPSTAYTPSAPPLPQHQQQSAVKVVSSFLEENDGAGVEKPHRNQLLIRPT